MKKFKTRPGVILASVCGEYVLVAALEARKYCPYLTMINESSAFLWRQLVDGADKKELIEKVASAYDVTDKTNLPRIIDEFLKQLDEAGYLLTVQEM